MSGVVHVGAHRGEEVSNYLAHGRDPIILFEPQDLGWVPPAGVTLVQVALGDHSDMLSLYVPHHLHDTAERDTQSTSGLPLIPERARANGWTTTDFDLALCNMVRFDEWASGRFQYGSCDLLVIDVQGMEMQVLLGFGSYLDGFERIKVECSQPPIYEGGSSAQEVVDFLRMEGFKPTSPIVRHGDIGFVRG